MKILKLTLFSLLATLLMLISACGYAPLSQISNQLFSDKIYVRVEISQSDPRNSVFVVDTLREILINKLGKEPVLYEEAKDFIDVRMSNLNFTPIAYDENGYVSIYRASLELNFTVRFESGKIERFKTSGNYDFVISPNSVISDSARLEAIRAASNEAFDEFISVLAIRGQQHARL